MEIHGKFVGPLLLLLALGTLTIPDTKAYWGQIQWGYRVLGYPVSWKNKRIYCMLREDYEG